MFDDVVCLSHLRWGFVFQRPNHLMSRCARSHRVFFVEEPHFDAVEPRLDVERREHGLHVVVPHLPPGASEESAERMQAELLRELHRREKITRPLAWLYTPIALPAVRALETVGCVYDCMDELSHFDGAPKNLVAREEELFRIADIVFTGGRSLYEAKRDRHRNVFAFPSSVDFAHFEQARMPLPDPPDQATLPRPRVGFFGVIDERIDSRLIDALATKRPDVHLVFIGPVVKIDPRTLPQRPNIHWLGQKQYTELPSYISGWDAAFMPFARNDATKFISPTKTLEYLAAGRQVVATSIRDVVRPYGDENLVRIADEPLAFAAAIDAVLAERGTPAAAAHRRAADATLARTSWDRTWLRMYTLVHDALVRRGLAIEEEGGPCSTS
jgi:UDP-galactopyranose mutase